jgi:hypothetical protein
MVVTDFRFADGDRIGLESGMEWTVTSDAAGNAQIDFVGGAQAILLGVAAAAVTADWFYTLS